MHSLAACAHVIVNPYQFGAGNDEALASGAILVLLRLGFRSVEREVHALARREFDRLRANRGYRVPIGTLRRLAACDLCLDLADSTDVLFDEAWLPATGRGITEAIACVPEVNRARAPAQLTRQVCAQLDVDPSARSARERRARTVRADPRAGRRSGVVAAAHKRAVVELACLRQAATERHFRRRAASTRSAEAGPRAGGPPRDRAGVHYCAPRSQAAFTANARGDRKRRAAHAARAYGWAQADSPSAAQPLLASPWPLRSSLRPRLIDRGSSVVAGSASGNRSTARTSATLTRCDGSRSG